MSAPTVLLTLGRLPKALDIARSFSAAGWRVVVAEPFARHLTGASRHVAKSVAVRPPSAGKQAYLDDLLRVVREEEARLVLPVSEETMHVAALHGRLPPGVRLFAPPPERLLPLHDKLAFARRCAAYGVRVPETHPLGTEEAAALAARQDVVVKPVHSCGGRGFRLVRRGAPLPAEPAPHVVQAFVPGRVHSSCGIAQEGRLVANAIYRGVMFAGSVATVFERVTDAPRIEEWIARFVAASGHTGFISFDLMVDEAGEPWGIECNPRATSGVHFLRTEAIAPAILEGIPAAPREEARLQQFYSVLTALSGVMFRRGYLATLRTLLGTRDVTWSWRDPLPFLTMTWTTWPILRLALQRRRPFGEVATLDLDWYEGERPPSA
ncbi:ATP-grasp domain-containing protein [Rubritepida flocculans]|uniref:ATP-grasp domain-containing protein n=1 Tax=Rubritepida flocculans TaxID=182403 RepID=UPI000413BF85|nr:ATP-grasp domain-containing protein [Rubritepida flocculans]